MYGNAVASGDAAGHEAGFGEGGRSVVHAGIRYVHACQLAGHGLELEHRLKGALADLRLIRRVRGVELAAPDDMGDRARNVVSLSAGAEERSHAIPRHDVTARLRRHLARQVEFGERWWEPEALDAELTRDVGEQIVDRRGAD